MNSAGPTVTVVILAFDRRQYLLDAARSARGAPAEGAGPEILVVKNFEDEAIDRELVQLGARPLIPEDDSQGAWLCQAAAEARGELLVFLDDDDLFAPEKLRKVRREFAKNPALGYYHNGHRSFRGTPPLSGVRVGRERPEPPARILRSGADGRKDPGAVHELWRAGGAFNLSSVAVRREFLLPFAERLRQLRGGAAAFLFYCGVLSTCDMEVDAASLTLYRIHSENISGAGARSPVGRWRRTVRLAPRIVSDADVILDTVRRSNADPRCMDPILVVRARNDLARAFGDARTPRTVVIGRLRTLGSITGRRQIRDLLPYLALALVRVVVPELSVRILGGSTPAYPAAAPRT